VFLGLPLFLALPTATRFLLIFALAFLPLSSGLILRESKSAPSLGMSAPTPLLVDSAKTRANVTGIDRITLYLPSLYTNYLSYNYDVSQEENLSSVVFKSRELSQWQRWQL
jgi:hypothetical protein